MSTALRALLHKHRETYRRLVELELADLDRQVAALDRDRPKSSAAQGAGANREHERAMLRVMQAAGTPLPPREIAQRLGAAPKTVSRWLAAAHRRGFVERAGGARYRVVAEVPTL
jgi:predicted Rossmann fold nucleotide-binding protein DprA/Smf involved in DNA uptake